MIIEREKACCFSGHRILKNDFSKQKLLSEINNALYDGYDTFLVGMALGFDTECFHILEEIRKNAPIKIVACVPCQSQSVKYSAKQKKEYADMLFNSDMVVTVSREYTPYCMQKRNMFMVDNSSLLITYLRQSSGGTFNTVKYAKQENIKIVEI